MLYVNDLDHTQRCCLGSIVGGGESLLIEPPRPHQSRVLPVPAGDTPAYGLVRMVPPMHVRVDDPEGLRNRIIGGICYGGFVSFHDWSSTPRRTKLVRNS